jgi:hypothetical protein
MPAATAITPLDRPGGQLQQVSFSLTPGAIAAAGTEVETIVVAGVNVGDHVAVSPRSGLQAGIGIGYCRVVSTNNVEFTLFNYTAGALTPTAGVWTLTIARGTTMVFAR